MDKKSQSPFSSVILVNPYRDTYLSGISSFLTDIPSPEFQKEQYAISYLNTRGFITSKIDITKNIPEEDLFDAINNKVYDEFALDQALSYQVRYIEIFHHDDPDNRHFHVFIVNPQVISDTFENVVSKIKYIDTIVPAPLLLKSLYEKEFIESNGVHCFIYFQKDDAFITAYDKKEFLYTKSIKYSFVEMHERFCELYGEKIEYEEFIEFLSTQNLKDTQNNYKTYLIRLYREIFSSINDILTYIKRAFEVEKIERIYIGMDIPTVTELDEMAESELGIKSSVFDFDYGFENKDIYISQLQALMHIYTSLDENERYECNFTTYFRPPSFIKRESGKISILIAASLIIAFAYPITYWIMTYAQSLQYDMLDQEYTELHNTRVTREATIKKREADKEKILSLLDVQKKEYTEKKNTLIKIHDVKVNYPMKAKLLSLLTKDLNRFGVRVSSVSYSENKQIQIKNTQKDKEVQKKVKVFSFDLIATRDKKITKLLEYLTKTHEEKFKFSLDEIEYNEDTKRYFSNLKVTLL